MDEIRSRRHMINGSLAHITVIVPVLNEADAIPLFINEFKGVIENEPYEWEVIFVDDGSTDATLDILKKFSSRDPRIKILAFSRNFGKEIAIAAGLRHASGDAAIIADVDLQDPLDLVPKFLALWQEGHDSVVGVRVDRSQDGALKRLSAGWFYHVFNAISRTKIIHNAGDYRLISRNVIDALNALPERIRFTKGLFGWVGFDCVEVPYSRPARTVGVTKWNFWRLWNFAIDGLTGFSTVPLRAWSYFGFLIALLSFGYAFVIVTKVIIFGIDVPGYASLMVIMLGIGGITFISLGILGEYLGRIYQEVKDRPLFIMREKHGFQNER